MEWKRSLSWMTVPVLALALCTGCNDDDDSNSNTTGGDLWTGTITATVDGVAMDFSEYPYHDMVDGTLGFGGNSGSAAVQFTVMSPAVGEHALGTGTMGIYLPDNTNYENVYTTILGLATGTLEITTISETRLVGTFAYTARNNAGDTVSITNGVVDISAE